jgi:hypothetical protein
METLQNEIISLTVIALVVIMLAYLTKKTEDKYK